MKFRIFTLAVIALAALSGYFLPETPVASEEDRKLFEKLDTLYSVISENYYGEVDSRIFFSGALNGMLSDLDPHSAFVDAVENAQREEEYRGNYQGIGVSFIMVDDKITVMSVVQGGPSAAAGLLMGDQIVEINGESAVGYTSDQVQEKLRGPGGTEVTVAVSRPFQDEPVKTQITRGRIPIPSVENALMLDDKTGYIRMIRFARSTAYELDHALRQLQSMGMQKLVLDLRGNGGGLLNTSIDVVDLFLSGRRPVVYTDGQTDDAYQTFYTSENGKNWDVPLVILIDHFSASASEIVSGSLQEWDRAVIVGSTSFGKGLVQSGFILKDQSRLFLTTSHYFTPSGRLIQRPYKGLDVDQYQLQGVDDYDPNNVETDNISIEDKPVYFTATGRTVYGGGGITPDVVVDGELMFDPFVYALNNQFVMFFTARDYYWQHKDQYINPGEFINTFQVSDDLLAKLLAKAKARDFVYYPRRGQKFTEAEVEAKFAELDDQLRLFLKAEIAQFYFDRPAGYIIRRLAKDNQLAEALKLFDKAEELVKMQKEINPSHFAESIKGRAN